MARKLYKKTDFRRAASTNSSQSMPSEPYRSDWRQDHARLIHSPCFRRLQGKTQLFPSHETDFYRNRLTHSIEVAQIAKSIAKKLNHEDKYFKNNPIDTTLIEFAAFAHDVGHPPFGHNGEEILNELMLDFGGFEGNAQTFRQLTRLEKKQTTEFPARSEIPTAISESNDRRLGLNLTSRSLAAVLKYDKRIPSTSDERKKRIGHLDVYKGYYDSESEIVNKIKQDVIEEGFNGSLKTIECSIMDVADDIAYSTYDLEDSFKAGFLSPLKMLAADDQFKTRLIEKISKRINSFYDDLSDDEKHFSIEEFNFILWEVFHKILALPDAYLDEIQGGTTVGKLVALVSNYSFGISDELCRNGYLRTQFTSSLVGRFIRGIEVVRNDTFPQLHNVRLEINIYKQVEVLKMFSYESLIMSPRLKLADHRGKEIIRTIFNTLSSDNGFYLLPDDWRFLYLENDDISWRKRIVCDFIAGMTDRYCIEFYKRVTGTEPPSIHKPID